MSVERDDFDPEDEGQGWLSSLIRTCAENQLGLEAQPSGQNFRAIHR